MSVIDWQALQPYREMMGEAFIIDILQTYLENSQTLLNDIESSFQNNDLATLSRAAHTLKSNSAMLGANTLAELCAKMEQAGKISLTVSLQADIKSLRQEHTNVCEQIREYLQKAI